MAAVIILHHSGALLGYHISPAFHGYMAVEFFFIVSGYLMMKTIAKTETVPTSQPLEKETWTFLKRKFTSVFPEVAIAFLLSLLLCVCCLRHPVPELLRWSFHGFWNDCLLLRSTAVVPWEGFNGVTWYISSMLLCMALLYPVFRRFRSAPFIAMASLLLLGLLYRETVQFHSPHTWMGLCYKANLRALCGISLGAFAYGAARHMGSKQWTRPARFLAMILKNLIGAFLLCYMLLRHSIAADGAITLLIWAYVVIVFSGVSPDSTLFSHAVFRLLGRLSLPLFLSHVYLTRVGKELFPADWSLCEKLLIYGMLVAASTAVVVLASAILRRYSGALWGMLIQRRSNPSE